MISLYTPLHVCWNSERLILHPTRAHGFEHAPDANRDLGPVLTSL